MTSRGCTPATESSPGSIFDNDWKSFGGDGQNEYEDLDDIDLDDILGPVPKPGDAAATINPQILRGAGSPDACLGAKHQYLGDPSDTDNDNIIFGCVPKIEDVQLNRYNTASPPAFHHSIEDPHDCHLAHYTPSPVSNQLSHRRSVSEPPAALLTDDVHAYGIPPLPQAPITFTRSGVSLGTPKVHNGNRITRMKHPTIHQPYPISKAWTQERYPLRRSNTQPLGQGPTSVPMARQVHHTPPSAMMQQPMYGHVGSPSVTSRVCTPAPSPPQQSLNPGLFDLQAATWPPSCEEKKAVTIPLTIDELRVMITEAVKAALSSAGARSSIEQVDPASGGVSVKDE